MKLWVSREYIFKYRNIDTITVCLPSKYTYTYILCTVTFHIRFISEEMYSPYFSTELFNRKREVPNINRCPNLM